MGYTRNGCDHIEPDDIHRSGYDGYSLAHQLLGAAYSVDDQGIRIRKIGKDRLIHWKGVQNLELCPHPRFEGISLLRFDVRDQGDPVEDISFTDGQIDTAGIFDLYHAGQARGFDFPIVCRPGPARWRSVFVCVALIPILVWMSTIPGDSRAPQPDWMPQILTGGLVGLFGLGSMWESLKIMRCEIRADEAGLRWRNVISGWKQVRWEEVSDYYLKRRGNDPHLTKLVSTPLGSLKLDAGTFSEKDMDQLTDLVVEKAVNVRRAGWEER